MKTTQIEKTAFTNGEIDPTNLISTILIGNVGTGKSTIARAIARKFGCPRYSMTELQALIKNEGRKIITDLSKKKCLILEDIYEIKDTKVFGEDINIIEELLLLRFDSLETMESNLLAYKEELDLCKKQNPKHYDISRLTEVINRYEERLKTHMTIITTNLTITKLQESVSDRLLDRLQKYMTVSIITGESFR